MIVKDSPDNNNQTTDVYCGLTHAMTILTGRWKINILWLLKNGVSRYGKLRSGITGISEKMLTERLRELEREGLVIRKDFQTIPPHVEYYLTDNGKLLEPLLDMLNAWGENLYKSTAHCSSKEEI